ncbi:hypothetical protein PENTCL1PPCAC_3380, partial [Pristionchus entomophagus]
HRVLLVTILQIRCVHFNGSQAVGASFCQFIVDLPLRCSIIETRRVLVRRFLATTRDRSRSLFHRGNTW